MIFIKATSQPAILCARVGAIKGTDNVLLTLHVLGIIPLNFACCTHPTHENRQVRTALRLFQ